MAVRRSGKRKAALRAASKFENQLNASEFSDDSSAVTAPSKAKTKEITDRHSTNYTVSHFCLLTYAGVLYSCHHCCLNAHVLVE